METDKLFTENQIQSLLMNLCRCICAIIFYTIIFYICAIFCFSTKGLISIVPCVLCFFMIVGVICEVSSIKKTIYDFKKKS